MADIEDPAVSATRLEQALERIAKLAAHRATTASRVATQPSHREPEIDTARIAARLDVLITQLRAVLSEAQRG